jgi:hypothetical protein
MTNEDLKSLTEATSPGPWEVYGDWSESVCAPMAQDVGNVVCMTPVEGMDASRAKWRANAAFIAAAREAVPRLLSEIEAKDAEIERLRGFLEKLPRHHYWMPGEPDCPRELKAGNGELHTLRCKRCGLDSPRDDVCRATLPEEG